MHFRNSERRGGVIFIMDKKTEDLIKAYKDERFNDCLLIANNLLKEDKNNLQVLSYKAGALKNLGRYKEAIDALNECITLNRDSWYLWVFRGDCYYELGDLEKACSDYWFSLQFEPQNGIL